MAPRSNNARPAQNGIKDGRNGISGLTTTRESLDAPPSTIAAQIVQTRTSVTGHQPESKALFGQLLQEYLNDTIAEDSTLETNAQLIQVVGEAGLNILTDDPFTPASSLKQAVDSLKVIGLTIKRKGRVLLWRGDADHQPPLVLWLLAKVMGLFCHAILSSLFAEVSSLLSLMVKTMVSDVKMWRQGMALHKLLGVIIESIISKQFSDERNTTREPINLRVPSASDLAIAWPDAVAAFPIPVGYQVTVSDRIQMSYLIINLLRTMQVQDGNDNHTHACPSISQAWYFQCCHDVLESSDIDNDPPGSKDQLLASMASFVAESVRKTCPKRNVKSVVELLTTLLERWDPEWNPATAAQLGVTFDALLKSCAGDQAKLQFCQRRILTAMNAIQHNQISRSLDGDIVPSMIKRLNAATGSEISNSRPNKQQKVCDLSSIRPDSQYPMLAKQLATHLGSSSTSVLLNRDDLEHFRLLSLEHQEQAIAIIGLIPCALDQNLRDTDLGDLKARCLVCDMTTPHTNRRADVMCELSLKFISLLLEDAATRRARNIRVALAIAIRRLLNHTSPSKFPSLEWEGIGLWLMRSLQSSSRELRMAAAEALMSYLREELPEGLRMRNRGDTLNFLRELSENDIVPIQETLVFTWVLLGKTCGEAELPLVLMQLVDYLGHGQTLVSGAAYHGILNLAEAKSCSTLELFKPFWTSIATQVVRDLFVRPQKAQHIADLLRMSVTDFLLLTQTDTVPYLVLTRRHDVLQRIANARGPTTAIQDLWLHPARNLAATVALLLVQNGDDLEATATMTLKDAASSFKDSDFAGLSKVEPIQIAYQILRYAADFPEPKKHLAHNGLRQLAAMNERKTSTKEMKSTKYLSTFLEANILGIMSQFTDVIDAAVERQPLLEKKRALRAIEELIKADKSQIGMAIPQIRATLQSAFRVPALVDLAFSCWSTLVMVAEDSEAETLIESTFALVAQYWPGFCDSTQKRAHDTVAMLCDKHNDRIVANVQMIPSLRGIDILRKFEDDISRLRIRVDPMIVFEGFAVRCRDENAVIVHRALVDLNSFLDSYQKVIHESALSSNPSPIIAKLLRALLDIAVRFKEGSPDILSLAAQCLGAIGTMDPNKIDQMRPRNDLLMLSNFEKASEVIDFAANMLENVLVDAFHSAPTGKAQTYLAYTMQELLKFCAFKAVLFKTRPSQSDPKYERWLQIPEAIRSTLTPFFNTKFALIHPAGPSQENVFPIWRPEMTHATWLRTLVFNLLHKAATENAQLIFPVLSRVIWGHDLSIPTFLLPFVCLNIIVGGKDDDVLALKTEFASLLSLSLKSEAAESAEEIKQCSENIFQVLDYLSRWLQAKRKLITDTMNNSRSVNSADFDELKGMSEISSVDAIVSAMPAEIISRRAVDCRSYARALFHYEQYIRETLDRASKNRETISMEQQFRHLQSIYAQIDEPDAIEGLSTKLQILDPEQQILEHKRAGRWTAAQTWYELELEKRPDDSHVQCELLDCLKASNRYSMMFDTTQSLVSNHPESLPRLLPFATEACWTTSKYDNLEKFLERDSDRAKEDFNSNLGRAMLALRRRDTNKFNQLIAELRNSVASGLSSSSTASLASAHPYAIKLHVLYELEHIGGLPQKFNAYQVRELLDRRLEILGAFRADKQYLLGIRRAAMELSSLEFTKLDIGAAWLASAKLARKAGMREAAYDAVLHAINLQDGAAMIEHSRLLWGDGHHRKAIQSLQGAIESNVFRSYTTSHIDDSAGTGGTAATSEGTKEQNTLIAKTQLLLAKWMDRAGHSTTDSLRNQFMQACRAHSRWEKGHYYMGKHYLKILEAEKALPRAKQGEPFLTADVHKLVIENFVRSMVFGSKYYYETIPKVLTLWLDLAADTYNAERNPRMLDQHSHMQRVKKLEVIHKQIKKYACDRIQEYALYTALSQITSRINHPHEKASELIQTILYRIISKHPQQALWSIFAVAKSRASDKSTKAILVINQLRRMKPTATGIDMKQLIAHAEKLTVALLAACDANVDSRGSRASLQKDLGFNHKLAPCQLVVPVEKALTASLPTAKGGPAVRHFQAFPQNPVTISSFQDEVLVLSSLQRPKKLVMRGSDGELYGLLCKPKDDLRKDQRLMEFTSMIDRGLKRDVESSKRRLYIHTYAVTPLNEECGAIEWIDGLKPMRDIILANYKAKGLRPDYSELRRLLDRACSCPEDDTWSIFVDQIIPKYPAVLHEWFIETFPEPESWFAARLRYTRSCAVMSMVGNALGLGDRHGENILLEEGNGGCFHVDFNCLFDKGLTFEKPELVPFRLTHNMTDAMGVYGFEGPFRTAAELTLACLKQYEDTLMTIMETFLYDPTTDFISKPRRRVPNVPETPAEVLETVKAKIQGLLPGESVPLSVDGYADALIKMATDPRRLCGMYIGWCAFF